MNEMNANSKAVCLRRGLMFNDQRGGAPTRRGIEGNRARGGGSGG